MISKTSITRLVAATLISAGILHAEKPASPVIVDDVAVSGSDLIQKKPEPTPAKSAVAEPVKPSLIKLDDTRYQIGEVILNRQNREIRFPAKASMIQGLVEYILVLEKGKVHEALLTTGISPTHLNLAFNLLGYLPSIELFSTIDETGHMSGIYPNVAAAVKMSARIAIEIEWSDHGSTHRVPINTWLQIKGEGKTMAAGPWLYSGSAIAENKFIPEITGDLAAIMVDSRAMINYPGADNQDQIVWYPLESQMPAVGTNLTVIISPFNAAKTIPKP